MSVSQEGQAGAGPMTEQPTPPVQERLAEVIAEWEEEQAQAEEASRAPMMGDWSRAVVGREAATYRACIDRLRPLLTEGEQTR